MTELIHPPVSQDSMSQPVRVHVFIQGRVQGVFFRQSAKAEAERLGLRGWVANREDGRVEGVAEGPQEAVDRWVEWCRTGPADAPVQHVEVAAEMTQGENAFKVLPHIR